MTCDACQDEVNKWLDWHPRFTGYEVRAYSVDRNAAMTTENYKLRADDHWGLVRTQISRIREQCRLNHTLDDVPA